MWEDLYQDIKSFLFDGLTDQMKYKIIMTAIISVICMGVFFAIIYLTNPSTTKVSVWGLTLERSILSGSTN